MGTYSYTFVSAEIPALPLMGVQLKSPTSNSSISLDCQAILDTGADCTLVPIPFVTRVEGRALKNSPNYSASCQPLRVAIRILTSGKFSNILHQLLTQEDNYLLFQ